MFYGRGSQTWRSLFCGINQIVALTLSSLVIFGIVFIKDPRKTHLSHYLYFFKDVPCGDKTVTMVVVTAWSPALFLCVSWCMHKETHGHGCHLDIFIITYFCFLSSYFFIFPPNPTVWASCARGVLKRMSEECKECMTRVYSQSRITHTGQVIPAVQPKQAATYLYWAIAI